MGANQTVTDKTIALKNDDRAAVLYEYQPEDVQASWGDSGARLHIRNKCILAQRMSKER